MSNQQRLRCLELVMEFGSTNDRINPIPKADSLYRYVTQVDNSTEPIKKDKRKK